MSKRERWIDRYGRLEEWGDVARNETAEATRSRRPWYAPSPELALAMMDLAAVRLAKW